MGLKFGLREARERVMSGEEAAAMMGRGNVEGVEEGGGEGVGGAAAVGGAGGGAGGHLEEEAQERGGMSVHLYVGVFVGLKIV